SRMFPAHRHRIKTIPNGVEYKGPETAKRSRQNQYFDIAVVGSLVPRKRVDCAIRAIALLPEELRRIVRLSVFGDGPELDSLRNLAAAEGLKAQVDLLGRVDPDEV